MRKAAAMAVWQKLKPYWIQSIKKAHLKLLVWDAATRANLVYGLDSLHLNRAAQDALHGFHLRGLRRILGMQTTYVCRANTNDAVLAAANVALVERDEAACYPPICSS